MFRKLNFASIDVGESRVQVTGLTTQEALTEILNFDGDSWRYVVTPNLHHLVMVSQDPSLARLYSEAWLSLPDGWPVAMLTSLKTHTATRRAPGSDLLESITHLEGDGRVLVLVGGDSGTQLAQFVHKLEEQHWTVIREPAPRSELVNPRARRDLIGRITALNKHAIVVLGVGAPRQEQLAYEITRMPGSGVVLCLGMSINFSSGCTSRAPRIVQAFGLEWLFRFISEPKRLGARYLADARAFPGLLLRNVRREN